MSNQAMKSPICNEIVLSLKDSSFKSQVKGSWARGGVRTPTLGVRSCSCGSLRPQAPPTAHLDGLPLPTWMGCLGAGAHIPASPLGLPEEAGLISHKGVSIGSGLGRERPARGSRSLKQTESIW